MKKIMLLSMLIALSQFVFAQAQLSIQKATEIDGCYYADILYKPGDRHRVQESIVDPVTHKVTMRDAKPEIWQECIEHAGIDAKISPRFYWQTLPNKK